MAAKQSSNPPLTDLETELGYRFRASSLLEVALTHRSEVYDTLHESTANGNLADPRSDNEQMEFLGDAVLGFLVAESFCHRFPGSREGELTRLRASVVSRKHLGEVGKRLDLGRWLRVGRTVEQTGGRASAALLSNAVEAVIAAIYLDGGLEAAKEFVERQILAPVLPELERSLARGDKFSGAVSDSKSALQEFLQGRGMEQPEYRLLEESGPAHKLCFRVSVWAAGRAWAEGSGTTKKQAQQEAARQALRAIQQANATGREGRS